MANIEKQNLIEGREVANLDSIMEALPEVQKEKNLWQNNFHEFDVYHHTVNFVECLKKILDEENHEIDLNLIAAGWLHDIGKPIVAKPKEKNGAPEEREQSKSYHKFTDHEIEGENMVRAMDSAIFEKLGLGQEKIASLVYCHYLPMKGIKEMRKTENWHKFRQKYEDLKKQLEEIPWAKDRAPVSKEEILLMFLADKLAQGDPNKYATDREELFVIRDVLLSKDKGQEEEGLKKVYELQKREAKKNKRYVIKE